jgi:hypothetical protein
VAIDSQAQAVADLTAKLKESNDKMQAVKRDKLDLQEQVGRLQHVADGEQDAGPPPPPPAPVAPAGAGFTTGVPAVGTRMLVDGEQLEVSAEANRIMRTLGIEPLVAGKHKLAVLVPFRNVEKELQSFVPHMHRFLKKNGIDFTIIIINQTDNWRFNRGQLLNVGEIVTRGSHDYIAMHDVDLLPMNDNLPYTYPKDQVAMHLASPKLHPMYHYKNFIGGVMVLQSRDFRTINGLSNNFWGCTCSSFLVDVVLLNLFCG